MTALPTPKPPACHVLPEKDYQFAKHCIHVMPELVAALENLIWIAEATHGAHDQVTQARAAMAKAKGKC